MESNPLPTSIHTVSLKPNLLFTSLFLYGWCGYGRGLPGKSFDFFHMAVSWEITKNRFSIQNQQFQRKFRFFMNFNHKSNTMSSFFWSHFSFLAVRRVVLFGETFSLKKHQTLLKKYISKMHPLKLWICTWFSKLVQLKEYWKFENFGQIRINLVPKRFQRHVQNFQIHQHVWVAWLQKMWKKYIYWNITF